MFDFVLNIVAISLLMYKIKEFIRKSFFILLRMPSFNNIHD